MTNFVKLTNDLLVRLNEVTLDEAGDGFDDVRGVQALAKTAINNSIREILQVGQEWPFLKTTYVQTLTPGQTTYDFPADYSSADYSSFYLKRTEALNNQPKYLDSISWEDYVQNYRDLDDTGASTGRSAPERMFQTYDEAFGVTPSPDKAYEVEYTYWKFPNDLVLYNDKAVIPGRFNHVIIDGAMMYMMRHRSNEQSAMVHAQKFEEGIRQMRRVLMDEPLEVRSTVVNRVAVNGR